MNTNRARRPNFLIIVADDLGFSDLGCYGGEIKTPVLDSLANNGVRMTNFHTASACSPTRSMLFSGTDNHIAGLGQMSEYMRPFQEHFRDKPGYEGYLNWKVAALSEILQDNGYHTMLSGKWHLGLTKELAPVSRGFDKNFSFLPGSGNHYAWEPQLDDDEFRMPCMKTDEFWMEGDRFIDMRTDLPKDFYSTTTFTDKLLGFMQERHEDSELSEKPFFACLPFTAPHWPLQAPKDVRQHYEGVYDDGPDALTMRRWRRMTELGIIEPGVECAPPSGALGPEWGKMTPEQQRESSRSMETFAAMVELIDMNVGRVVEYLKSTGEFDDTFILFMSDNGAEGAALEAIPLMGGATTFAKIIEKHYDNSYDNIGEPTSFAWYGPRWACAASAPSRAFKCWTYEGGIRCPCLVHYPRILEQSAAIAPTFTTVMDILPTCLELAGISPPSQKFRGREVVAPRGKSWVEYLSSSDRHDTSVHGDENHIHGWELFGQRAIREGPWKAVWIGQPKGKGAWELYNLDKDRAEQHDLAATEPDILAKLTDHWERYFAETGMIQTPMFGTEPPEGPQR